MLMRFLLALTLALAPAKGFAANECAVEFTIRVTQGVGHLPPGMELTGRADYTSSGQSIRQEGGAVAHLAQGEMRLGDDIAGHIWTLVTKSNGTGNDLLGIYATRVEGLSFAGVDYDGPMLLTLFGVRGTRQESIPPLAQQEWDSLDLRRSFSLHASGFDMLAGTVTDLTAECS